MDSTAHCKGKSRAAVKWNEQPVFLTFSVKNLIWLPSRTVLSTVINVEKNKSRMGTNEHRTDFLLKSQKGRDSATGEPGRCYVIAVLSLAHNTPTQTHRHTYMHVPLNRAGLVSAGSHSRVWEIEMISKLTGNLRGQLSSETAGATRGWKHNSGQQPG